MPRLLVERLGLVPYADALEMQRRVARARIAGDVTPELAREAIESVTVLGAFQASPAVRRALSDRIH